MLVRLSSQWIPAAGEMQIKEPIPVHGFFDLTKTFDVVNQEALWRVLLRFSYTVKFVTILRLLHDDMEVMVMTNGTATDPFPVRTGIKQDCVIVPNLFTIYLTLTFHLTADKLPAGVELTHRTCGKFSNLCCLQAETKVTPTRVIELHTFTENVGLTLIICKTKILHQPGLALWRKSLIIKVHGEALGNVGHFQYLGSVLSAKAAIVEEIQQHLQRASPTFSCLKIKVFEDSNFRSNTKLTVYRAVVVPTILYGSEMWTVYSRYLKALEQEHQCHLRRILQIRWEERCTNSSVLNQGNIPSIEALTTLDWLQWAGHFIRMTNTRIPKLVLLPASKRKDVDSGGFGDGNTIESQEMVVRLLLTGDGYCLAFV
eukprot:g43756.t1